MAGMKTNAQRFSEILKKNQIRFTRTRQPQPYFLLNYSASYGTAQLRVLIEDNLNFQIFGATNISAPPGSRRDMSEAIVRANYGMRMGRFELDMRDGEILFHLGIPMGSQLPDEETLMRLIGLTMSMINRYVPAFLSIIYANEMPQEAIERVEKL